MEVSYVREKIVRDFGASRPPRPALLSILLVVMMAVGCSSEPSGYSGADAGDPQLDAGDEEDVDGENGQDDVGQSDEGDVDTGDPDTGEPDTGAPDVGEPDAGAPDTGEPDDVVNCDERPPLSDLSEWSVATDVIHGEDSDPNYYTEVFRGDEFPGTSNNFPFYLEKGQYVAMEFTVPEDLIDRGGSWTVAPITHIPSISGAGRMFSTLTRCPGDFDVSSFDDPMCGRVATISEGWIRTRWTTDPNDSDERRCYIEPGETYYLNILYTHPGADPKDFPPEQSDCGGQPNCGNHFQRGFLP